jgi:hypothetical protein
MKGKLRRLAKVRSALQVGVSPLSLRSDAIISLNAA